MARTSYTGYLRQYGSTKRATPVPFIAYLTFSFDPTQVSASVGKTLPAGAIPIYSNTVVAGATGGVNPTVNIGTQADPDGFAIDLDADGNPLVQQTTGALLGSPLTADTVVFAGVGSSAATGGTVAAAIAYVMADDGSA